MTAPRDTLNALLDGLLPAADNAGAPIIAAQEWNALKPTPHAGDGEKGPNADEAALLADEVTRGANAPDAMRVVPAATSASQEIRLPSLSKSYVLSPSWTARHHAGDEKHLTHADRAVDGSDDDSFAMTAPSSATPTAMAPLASGPAVVNGSVGDDVIDKHAETPTGNAAYWEIHGAGGRDYIVGYTTADYLFGDSGSDTLAGGAGDDRIYGGIGFDYVDYEIEQGQQGVVVNFGLVDWKDHITGKIVRLGEAIDSWGSRDTFGFLDLEGVGGTAFNDVIWATSNNSGVGFEFVGRGGNDDLAGGGGNDTLDGGVGYDTINGGAGDDYIIGAADGLVDQMIGEQGNDTLIGGGEDYAEGGDGNNDITAGHVTYNAKTSINLDLGGGLAYHDTWLDQLTGVYWVKSGASNDRLVAGDRGVYFDAGDGLNTLQGGRGNDELHGGGSDDLFIGSLGSDVMGGDSGINTVDYINVASEIAVNLRNERAIKAVGGEDTLVAIKNVWGSNRDDSIIGDDGVVGNYLNGRWGNDTIEGLGGNDDLHGDEGHDKILGGFGQDKLYGDGGNDSLDGGDGADRMEGGAGNDAYTVDNPADIIVEAAGAGSGTDTVYTSLLTYTLGTTDLANVENLSSVGSANFTLTGNNLANSIVGGDGLDTLDGSGGADTMVGGKGNDTYTIDNLGDTPIEDFGAAAGTWDTAYIWVKNFDADKLANIENALVRGQGSINHRPDAPIAIEPETYTLAINENTTGTVARVNSKDDGNGGALKYYLVNNFGGKFTIDENLGIISLATGVNFENDPGLVTINGKKYFNLEVYSLETETGALQSKNGTIQIEIRDINEAPTAILYQGTQIDEKAEVGSQIGTVPVVSDPDGPAEFRNFTFALVGAPDGKTDGTGIFAIGTDGTIRVGQARLPDVNNPTPLTVKVKVTDAGGLSWVQDVIVTVTPIENAPPQKPAPTTTPRVIDENDTGTVAFVHSEDDNNGGALLYKLVNNFGNKISISQQSGEISVAREINYETDPDLKVLDRGTDHERRYFEARVYAEETTGGQVSGETVIQVFIKNVNEKATIALSNGSTTLQAGTTKAGTAVVLATASDPDTGYSGFANNLFKFANGTNKDGAFIIDENGQVTTWRDLSTDDTQPKTLHITAYDSFGVSTTIDYVINVAADVAPTNVRWNNETSIVQVEENSTVVGIVLADDNGGREHLHYALAPNALFAIDAISGAVTVKPDARLNFEAGDIHTVQVIVTDANGLLTTQSLTVKLTDVNEAPTGIRFDGHAIQVGATGQGDIFVNAFAIDPDIHNPDFQNNYFSFANGLQRFDKFFIDRETGEISVFEDLDGNDGGRTVDLVVVAYDSGFPDRANTQTYSFTILAANNTAPRDVRFASGGGVDENKTDPSVLVGQLTATDNGPQSDLRYFMEDNVNFSIDAVSGQVFVKDTAQLDHESTEPYTVTIEVVDGEGKSSGRQVVAITVNDVNEAPDSIAFIASGDPVKVGTTQVGTVFVAANAHDPDIHNPEYTINNKYSFVGGGLDFGKFRIDRDTGQIKLTGELTADDVKHYALEVVSYDEKDPGLLKTAIYDFDIFAADNTPPSNIHWASGGSILENTAPATVGVLTATDDGGPAGLTYSIAPNGLFDITANGQIVLIGQPSFDYEAQSVYHIDVTATDGSGERTTQQIDITVTNDNEAVDAVTVTAAADPIQVGHTQMNGSVAQAVAHDPDLAEAFTHNRFVFEGGAQRSGKFAIDDAGNITLAEPLIAGEEGSYTLSIVVYDVGNPQLQKQISYTFEVLPAAASDNHSPTSLTLNGGLSGTVLENHPGRQVGILVGSDPDVFDPESTLHYKLALNGDPSGRFEVVGNVLKLKDHVAVDFEGQQVFTVRVVVSDEHGGTFEQELTINVEDEFNDPINHDPDSLTFADLTQTARAREHIPNLVIGTLFATDPDANDFGLLHFELVSDPSGKFRILENGSLALKENEQLDYDASGPNQHLVVVRVTDGHGGSLNRALLIEVVSEDVIDAPPVIAVTGDTVFTIDDAATVAPLAALTVGDVEDDASGKRITVTVGIGPNTGVFENLPDMADFPGATLIYTVGDAILRVIGTHDQVNQILHRLQFNPDDLPESAGTITTTFTVDVLDSLGQVTSATTTVHAVSTGVPNETPVIHVDPNGTTDWPGIPDTTLPFAAFDALSITDDGTFVSVTIGFDPAQGDFVLPQGDFGVEFDYDHDGSTFLIRGAPGDVSAFIRAVLYSPADYPNEPVGTSHPTGITIEVLDSRGALTTLDVSIDVVTANRAPSQIHFVDYVDVAEDAGVNYELGSLGAQDSNGDPIAGYRMTDSSGGLFKLQKMPDGRWVVLVNGPLDFEEGAPFHENGKTWYEIKVQASDGTDWSAEQTLKVFITDVEPDNSAPVITVNGGTTWQVEDTGTVAPFANMTLSDAEDGAADPMEPMTVVLSVDDNSGVFVLPDPSLFPDVTVFWDPAMPGNVTAMGLQGALTNFIHAVQFNPVNRPADAGNPATRVQSGALTIQLFDSDSAQTMQHVTVESTATGQAADNLAPTITVSDHAATQATDHGLPVTPFTHVTLADHETDDVILTIAFDWREGELLGTGVEGVKAGNRITYTLMGKAADLTLLLRQVSFDPTNHDGPGNPVTTRFDIALNDVHHAIGSADHVEVVTTVTGPDTLDNVYIVDAANPNPVINEDANPAIGGFDRAIVSIDAYTLAAGQGVETLEAAASVDHGITLVGNDLANTIIGGIGDDTLEGGGVTGPVMDTNHDVLRGGLGDDTYVIRQAGVVIEELDGAGSGLDTVQIVGGGFGNDWTYTLGQYLETLDGSASTGSSTLAGNGLDNLIVGSASQNRLIGGDGNDTLDGGVGVADLLRGGAGDDVYLVHNMGDRVSETESDSSDTGGFDTVRLDGVAFDGTWNTYALGLHVEALDASGTTGEVTLIGNGDGNAITGNGSANVLQGEAGNDTLDGGAGGPDRLVGGLDDDTYRIRNAGDVIVEDTDPAIGGANDVAEVFVQKYDLADGVGVELVQAQDIGQGVWLIGNDYANTLEGNRHDDTLDGGNGSVAHRLIGGAGNDIYVIRNSGDLVTDTAGVDDAAYVYTKDFTTIALRDAFIDDLKTTRGIETVFIDTAAPGADGPIEVVLAQTFVDELSATGNYVTQISVLNGVPNGEYTFNLEGEFADRFYIDGNFLRVKNGILIDFEEESVYALHISVTLDGVTSAPFEIPLTVVNLFKENASGGDGGDLIKASSGDDRLSGRGGNDELHGGFGNDELDGGSGHDVFVFDTALSVNNVDTINEFNVDEDMIHLQLSVFDALGQVGALTPDMFAFGAEATSETQRILYDPNTGELKYDYDGTGSEEAVVFAILDAPALSHNNFMIV